MGATVLLAHAGAGCSFHYADQPATTVKTSDGAEYLAHEVIVKLRAGSSKHDLEAALAEVGGKIQLEQGAADTTATATAGSASMASLGYYRVQLPGHLGADDAIIRLAGEIAVGRAERSYLVHTSVTPNDPRWGELWGMSKIGAPAAWDSSTGSAQVLVAVSDTGMDYNHPDLTTNVWTNPGEIPGNGKDDDGNGYIDDVHGYDFANSDGDPMDDNGHGTHVSGTIGGIGNNGVGVAGVNWRVKIQAVKFLGSSGSGSMWGGAQTILYAAKMKARVVNASWGCLGPGCYASYIEDAIKTLADAGGLFVAAAGNSANNNDAYPNYPSNYAGDNIVAVAATDSNDNLASFSDWGATRVHLGAPGVGILSSLPGASYASWNGTSMATPHVVGAAALFLSLRPDATYAEVKQKLMDSADKVSALNGKTISGGRLNVSRLLATAGKPPAAPSGFEAVPGNRADVLLSWTPNTETDLAGYRVRWGTTAGQYSDSRELTQTPTSTRITGLTHGTAYYFALYALSAKGLLSPASVEKRVVAVDGVAPPQVVDLAASTTSGATALVELDANSGSYSAYWSAENAIDQNPATAWMSPARLEAQEEFLSARLLMPYLVDAVDLVPNAAYPAFFPVDFDVELSTDGSTWTAVGGQRNATVAANEQVRIAFRPPWLRWSGCASCVRISTTGGSTTPASPI
ncbi:MAG: S8 family serine peptidase [Myxococcales bacterium]